MYTQAEVRKREDKVRGRYNRSRFLDRAVQAGGMIATVALIHTGINEAHDVNDLSAGEFGTIAGIAAGVAISANRRHAAGKAAVKEADKATGVRINSLAPGTTSLVMQVVGDVAVGKMAGSYEFVQVPPYITGIGFAAAAGYHLISGWLDQHVQNKMSDQLAKVELPPPPRPGYDLFRPY